MRVVLYNTDVVSCFLNRTCFVVAVHLARARHLVPFLTCSYYFHDCCPPSLRCFSQFFYYLLSFAILIVYVSQVVVLFTENALRDVALVNLAFKSLHLITGMVIMIPVLLLSFFPLFVDLQTRMLFNEDFSQRYALVLLVFVYFVK